MGMGGLYILNLFLLEILIFSLKLKFGFVYLFIVLFTYVCNELDRVKFN